LKGLLRHALIAAALPPGGGSTGLNRVRNRLIHEAQRGGAEPLLRAEKFHGRNFSAFAQADFC
jgi:hypothetical protein